MKIIVLSPDEEAEKRLLRVLAEVALEVGREEGDGKDGRCVLAEVGREEADDGKKSCRILPCIDSIE